MARQKKTERVDTTSERKSLTDNPFAALRGEGLPQGVPVDKPAQSPPPPTESSYRVRKTAKGGYHLSIEKRAAGKVVTIVHNVEGDGELLARDLKKHCGVGGTYTDGAVELQGDVREKVDTLLRKWQT